MNPLRIDEGLFEFCTAKQREYLDAANKHAMHASQNWNALPDDMREALEMSAHKIGRILCGDYNYHDSWHDINGYIKLVADRLELVPPEDEWR